MSAIITRAALLVLFAVGVAGCAERDDANSAEPVPPVAKSDPVTLELHGDRRIDDFFWIRDDSRSDPEVIALLDAENEYTQAKMSDTAALQDQLFTEITSRLAAEDDTVPIREGDYLYHREFRIGGEHPVYVRQAVDGAAAEVILDVNQLAEGHDYYSVANWSVSPGQDLVAFAEDTVSRREYAIRFRNLVTGEYLGDRIEGADSGLAWASDNRTLFYVRKHPVTLLPYQVFRHVLGTPAVDDVLVYEERDTAFWTNVYASRSDRFVVIVISSTDTSEVRLIDADRPKSESFVLQPRRQGHEYRVRHVPGHFYFLTNWNARNFRLMRAAEETVADPSTWEEIVPPRDDVLITDFEVFTDAVVVNESVAGLPRFRVIDTQSGVSRAIEFPEATYTARLHSNPEIEARALRYVYSSLTTPESVYEFDMETGKSRLLKQNRVLGDFDSSRYLSERLFIEARDGTSVPVSLVYRADRSPNGANPLYVYGYGSYGLSVDPAFSTLRLPLLDRGFVYAIAHVRGGQELGREWYEQGKLLNKRNTFNDFIDATRALIKRGYGAPDKVIAAGGSAGGLLMGVIANEVPQLYRGIIAKVPFVDVVTTMLDDSIPLVTGEYSEWGNPRDERFYDYMLSYSPYDQVKAQDYPNMLVTTGLWDSQVQYFEPVKWVEKLRAHKTDDNLLLLHVDMSTGHSGASGRYARYRLDALEYAFILKILQ